MQATNDDDDDDDCAIDLPIHAVRSAFVFRWAFCGCWGKQHKRPLWNGAPALSVWHWRNFNEFRATLCRRAVKPHNRMMDDRKGGDYFILRSTFDAHCARQKCCECEDRSLRRKAYAGCSACAYNGATLHCIDRERPFIMAQSSYTAAHDCDFGQRWWFRKKIKTESVIWPIVLKIDPQYILLMF